MMGINQDLISAYSSLNDSAGKQLWTVHLEDQISRAVRISSTSTARAVTITIKMVENKKSSMVFRLVIVLLHYAQW
jgi:hypothetical protein